MSDKRVPLPRGLTPDDDERKLHRHEAEERLYQLVRGNNSLRLPRQTTIGVGYQPPRGHREDLTIRAVATVIEALGDEWYYDSVLTRMDRGWVFAQVAEMPQIDSFEDWTDVGDTTVGDATVPRDVRIKLAEWATTMQDRQAETAAADNADRAARGLGPREEGVSAEASIAEMADEWRSLNDSFLSPNLTAMQDFEFLTPSTIQWMIRNGGDQEAMAVDQDMAAREAFAAGLDEIPRNERAGLALENLPPEMRVTVEEDLDPTMRRTGQLPSAGSERERLGLMRMGDAALARAQGERSYTFTEARALLYNLEPAEIEAIQNTLAAAGYFGDGGPEMRGDPLDRPTQRAWQNMLHDSVRTGESIPQLTERRRQLQEQRIMAERVEVSDPERIRFTAQRYAKDMLGRGLSRTEEQRMVRFMQELEADHQRERMRHASGLPGSGGMVDEFDRDSRIADQLRTEFGTEERANRLADQFDSFAKMFLGGDRTVKP